MCWSWLGSLWVGGGSECASGRPKLQERDRGIRQPGEASSGGARALPTSPLRNAAGIESAIAWVNIVSG